MIHRFNSENKYDEQLFNLIGKRRDEHKTSLFFKNKDQAVYHCIKANMSKIITDGKIDLSSCFSGEKYETLFIEQIYPNNKRLFKEDSYAINEPESSMIIDLLKKMKEEDEEMEDKKTIKDINRDFHECIMNDDGELISNTDFNINSFIFNMFFDYKSKYMFNERLEEVSPKSEFIFDNIIKKQKLEIIGLNGEVNYPVRYQVVCTDKTDGVYCGNVVEYSELNFLSKVKCTDSFNTTLKGHTIKTPEKGRVIRRILLYNYTVKALDDDKVFDVYSMVKLNNTVEEVNILYSSMKGDKPFIVVIAKNEKFAVQELEEKFFIREDKQKYALHDIYESAKRYLWANHQIELTDQNRIIGEIDIFQIICNVFYDIIFRTAFFGTSGVGKSFWSGTIIPIFTPSSIVVQGTSVTRNRLLGGKSAESKGAFSESYSHGYVTKHELLILEESTNELKAFQEAVGGFGRSSKSLEKNVFSMLKGLDYKYQKFDVGIQGSPNSTLRASICMLGNMEQLNSLEEIYVKKVRDKYRKYREGTEYPPYSAEWNSRMQIEYYAEVMKNEALAKAHAHVREEMLPMNHLTLLPEAEQTRTAIMIIFEMKKDNAVDEVRSTKNEMVLKKTMHTASIRKELSEIITTKEINPFFREEFFKFMNHYFAHERNNIIITDRNYNIHLRQNLIDIMMHLVIFNKQYYGQTNFNVLTREEKNMVRYYMRFFYNVLTPEEAAMQKTPMMNDLYIYTGKKIKNEFYEKEDKIEEDILNKKNADEGSIIIDLSDMEDFEEEINDVDDGEDVDI